MSDAEIAWLDQREPRDHAARSDELAREFGNVLGPLPRVIDIGCGTGSNYRYLRSRLNGPARWLCIDRDRGMLDRAAARTDDPNVEFERRDVVRELSSLGVEPGTAITISALLDATSAAWLDQLASWCEAAPLLAAMSLDGGLEWQPSLPEDEQIRRQWLSEGSRDEGFGPSLGKDAAGYLAGRLREQGHRVAIAKSDWQLGQGDRALLEMMVRGIARRVRGISPGRWIDDWLALRTRQIEADGLRLRVGHVDLLAVPGKFEA